MSDAVDCDVLVVGAGPTGLMLANQLARRGVGVQLIDRNAGPSVRTKALGVQARTLEIYAQLGIVERALALGKRATGAVMWTQGRRAARVPLGDIGRDLSPFPFLLILGQDDNEALLGEALRRHNVDVAWQTELVALEPHPQYVRALLKSADGSTRALTARWVAGCDGAHSAVRHLNNIDFPGAPYEHIFFVADTTVVGPMVPDELNVFLWRNGFHLFFPMRGTDHWRVVGIVPRELRGRDDLEFMDVVPSLLEQAGANVAFHACRWFSTYRIHHRRAQRFRAGRCFLLGDAAHIHSPVGAQGMNTGLQDAYNLGWKLALVATGRARDSLLDSYAAEREPVAERLLKTTDRAFTLIVSDTWLSALFRTRVLARILAFAMGRTRTRQLAFRTISQIGVQYRAGPLSETQPDLPPHAPRAGDRFPWLRVKLQAGGRVEDLYALLGDQQFTLIVVGQPTPDVSALHHVRVLAIADDPENQRELARVGIPRPSFYLIRPDGYIGLAGITLTRDVIVRYLQQRVALTDNIGSFA